MEQVLIGFNIRQVCTEASSILVRSYVPAAAAASERFYWSSGYLATVPFLKQARLNCTALLHSIGLIVTPCLTGLAF